MEEKEPVTTTIAETEVSGLAVMSLMADQYHGTQCHLAFKEEWKEFLNLIQVIVDEEL